MSRFDPDRDFARFRVAGFTGPDGRGWRIHDKQTGQTVAEYQTGNGQHDAYLHAQADAARRNLHNYEERTCRA